MGPFAINCLYIELLLLLVLDITAGASTAVEQATSGSRLQRVKGLGLSTLLDRKSSQETVAVQRI